MNNLPTKTWTDQEEALLRREFARGVGDNSISRVFAKRAKNDPHITFRTATAISSKRSALGLSRAELTVAKPPRMRSDLSIQILELEKNQCRNPVTDDKFCGKKVPSKRWESAPYCDDCIVIVRKQSPTKST